VVIDSPAAFGVADCDVLSTVVDGVLVVARGGRTRRPSPPHAAEPSRRGARRRSSASC
jgi:hypothetical protein